jgi:ATP-dependent Clp protease ATP-binding subunit ClpB
MEISDQALDELGKTGFDPVYGARPLKREIQQVIENPIAMAILSGKFGAGDRIKIDLDAAGEFTFEGLVN